MTAYRMSPQSRLVLRMLAIVGTFYCVSRMDPSFVAGKHSATDRNESLRPGLKVPFIPTICIKDGKAHACKTNYSRNSDANSLSILVHDIVDRMSGIKSEDRTNRDNVILQNQIVSVNRTSEKRLVENDKAEDDRNSDVREDNRNDGNNDLQSIYYLRAPRKRQKQLVRTKHSPNKNTVSSVSQRFSEKQVLRQKKFISGSYLKLASKWNLLQKMSTSRESPHTLFKIVYFSQKQCNIRKVSHKASKVVSERMKRSGSLSSQLTSFSSCKGKCGGTQALPCRCDIQCLVYGNCCKDFDQECPRIKKMAHSKWTDTLLSAEIMCDSKSSVFMVTSCDATSNSNVLPSTYDNFLQNESDTTPNHNKFKEINIFADLVRNAPVTNAATGIVFRNRSIFNCHNGPDSIPVVWGVHIPYTKLGLRPPSSVDEIKQMLNSSDAYYAVDASLGFTFSLSRNLRGAPCKSESIGKCNPQLDNVTAVARKRCSQRISYVAVSDDETIYNNEYCLWCNFGATEKVYIDKINKDLKHMLTFNLLLRLTDKDLSARMISTRNFGASNSFPWTSFQCPFQAGKSACHIIECLSAYTLINGMCIVTHVLEVSFVVYQTSLSTWELKLLSNITECVLKDFFGSNYLSTEHLSRGKISKIHESETYEMKVEFQNYHVTSLFDHPILALRIQEALYVFSISNKEGHCPPTCSSAMGKLDVNNVNNSLKTSWNDEVDNTKKTVTNAETKESQTVRQRNTFSFCLCSGLKKSNSERICTFDCDTFMRRIPFNESAIHGPPKHCVKAFMSRSDSSSMLISDKKSCLYQLLVSLVLLQILRHYS